MARKVGALMPGGGCALKRRSGCELKALSAPWRKYQCGLSLDDSGSRWRDVVNIGVGPSNAKTITDHLAVLRPALLADDWTLRRPAAHANAWRLTCWRTRICGATKILDDRVPLEIPSRLWRKCRLLFNKRRRPFVGGEPEELRRRLRTGTVVSYADRNWELNYNHGAPCSRNRARSRSTESACVGDARLSLAVPYGVLLCVSDKPAHGEIKLPGTATASRQRIGAHLRIGLETVALLKKNRAHLHSRKLRAFDDRRFM